MLTQTFLNSSTLEKNSFIRKMETSVYYPLMSLSWLYKQCYKTLNLSCQVRVLAKAFKQAICQVTNPCRQNLLMMNYCTHYKLENLFHHSHSYSTLLQVGLHRQESLWSSPQGCTSERWVSLRLNMFKSFRHIWKFLPQVGWWILADTYSRAWGPRHQWCGHRTWCHRRGNASLPMEPTQGNRMQHWIKQVSFLRDEPKLLRINAIMRNKRNSNTSFQKALWLYIRIAGFLCLANNYTETQISFISIQWETSINIRVKIPSFWLKFSNGVKLYHLSLMSCFLPYPLWKGFKRKVHFQNTTWYKRT